MSLPEEAIADAKSAVAALKKKAGIEFYIIPPKADTGSAWFIVDKLGRGRAKLKAALKIARKSGDFKPAKVAAGRVERLNKRLVFVTEQEVGGLEGRIGKWARALKNESDADARKLASLLRGVKVFSEEQFTKVSAEDVSAGDYGASDGFVELSEEELEEFFGEDLPEITSLSTSLSLLNEKLAIDLTSKGVEVSALLAVASGSDRETLVGQLEDVIPEFIKMLALDPPSSSAPLTVGTTLDPKDAVLALATQYTAALQQVEVWEKWVKDSEDYAAEVDRLEDKMVTDSWDNDTDTPEYNQYVSLHNDAYGYAESARLRVTAAISQLSTQFTALTSSTD